MIKSRQPLSFPESLEYIKDSSSNEVKTFIKSFNILSAKEGKELREKIRKLNILKLNENSITKIIDLLPDSKEELQKITQQINLDENEINHVLDTIKQYK